MLKDVIDANIKVHTAMAERYNSDEPHFRAENREQVLRKLRSLRERSGSGDKLLDVGCGTGFIINLVRDLYTEIHGIDVTQAMLDMIDTSSGNIVLHKAMAEDMPFDDGYFDIVTSYAFIHHVFDYQTVLREIYRVLRPGGLVYIDLEPNMYYWKAMVDLQANPEIRRENLSDIVNREIDSVLFTGERVEKEYGIEKSVFDKAEYTKTIMGGIDPDKFGQEAGEMGFSECETTYLWYLGQGSVMHDISFATSNVIDDYLKRILPLSRHLYKYLRFVLRK